LECLYRAGLKKGEKAAQVAKLLTEQKDALKSLADSIKEYVLTALENRGINTIFDPAHGKYWRMYNELEAKQVMNKKFDLPANVFEK